MKFYSLKDKLPPPEIMDEGTDECWWWNQNLHSWSLGSPLLFGEYSIGQTYTHWAPKEEMEVPPEKEGGWIYNRLTKSYEGTNND
jgi:hypothetical protein